MEKCSACYRANPKHMCAGCTQVLYCGEECAHGDWKNHLTDCKPIETSMSYMFLLNMKSRLSAWRMIYEAYGNNINQLVLDLNDFDMDKVKFYDVLHNEIITDRKQDREEMAYDVDEDKYESVLLHKKSFEQYRRQLTNEGRKTDDLLTPEAQRGGIVKLLRFLLEDKEGSLFVRNNYGIAINEFISSLFYTACRLGALEVIKMLTEVGFRRPTQINLGLIEAGSNYEVVKYLLNDLNADPTFNNYTALYNALNKNNKDVVLLILQNLKSDIVNNVENVWLYMVMFWANVHNYVDVIRLMLMLNTPKHIINTCFLDVCNRNRVELVNLYLKDKRTDPSYDKNKAIIYASTEGHIEIVRLLLQDKRVDPSDRKNKAIIQAAMEGKTEIVCLLLQDKRVDPSDNNNRAIREASKYGYVEVVRRLLQHKKVDPSVENNYAVRKAAKKGYVEVVRLLLQDKRVDPSADDNNAIKRASVNGHMEIVKLLYNIQRVRDTLSQEEFQILRVQYANYMNSERKGYFN